MRYFLEGNLLWLQHCLVDLSFLRKSAAELFTQAGAAAETSKDLVQKAGLRSTVCRLHLFLSILAGPYLRVSMMHCVFVRHNMFLCIISSLFLNIYIGTLFRQ